MKKINLELIYDGEEDTLNLFLAAVRFGLRDHKHPRSCNDVNMNCDVVTDKEDAPVSLIIRDETILEAANRVQADLVVRGFSSLMVKDESK